MTLNNEQLHKIDQVLEDSGLDFLDFKLEIKDHIASQIETLCKEENLSFESALSITLEQWKPHLRLNESFWISNKQSFPRIVITGLRKRYFVYNFISTTLVILLFAIDIFKLRELKFNGLYLFLGFSLLWLILSVFRYTIYKTGIKTSYSYEFNRMYLLISLMLGLGGISLFSFGENPTTVWNIVILAYTPVTLYSYFKHRQFEKKYQFV
ncbi:MAG: hypothetical protein WCY89_02310 [Flavobacteriaceae bacterium]